MWQSEAFHPYSSSEGSSGSSSDSNSSVHSEASDDGDDDVDDVDAAVGPALVVRGVQPYRFEPLAPVVPAQADEQNEEDEAIPRNLDRLQNTEW